MPYIISHPNILDYCVIQFCIYEKGLQEFVIHFGINKKCRLNFLDYYIIQFGIE